MVLMFKSAKLAGAEERERNEQLIPPGTDLNTLLLHIFHPQYSSQEGTWKGIRPHNGGICMGKSV